MALGLSRRLDYYRSHWSFDVDLFQEKEMAIKRERIAKAAGNAWPVEGLGVRWPGEVRG